MLDSMPDSAEDAATLLTLPQADVDITTAARAITARYFPFTINFPPRFLVITFC
jgi:hypothetical protein